MKRLMEYLRNLKFRMDLSVWDIKSFFASRKRKKSVSLDIDTVDLEAEIYDELTSRAD